MFLQTRANLWYVSIYERGYVPHNHRGWDYSVDTKDVNIEILHFKQFYKHFVFDKDEEGYVKKTQKNCMDIRVVLRPVWGNTKNKINSFCTFYKSGLKSCSFFIVHLSELSERKRAKQKTTCYAGGGN